MSDEPDPTRVWWAISGEAILNMLHRVHQGEDPDLVYIEEYANTDDHEHIEPEDDASPVVPLATLRGVRVQPQQRKNERCKLNAHDSRRCSTRAAGRWRWRPWTLVALWRRASQP